VDVPICDLVGGDIYTKGTTSDEAEGSEGYCPDEGGGPIIYSDPEFTDEETSTVPEHEEVVLSDAVVSVRAEPGVVDLSVNERYVYLFG
jgi:hypothetical protein